MVKELSCIMCEKNMGEMEKGKIRKGYTLLCKECWDHTSLVTARFLKGNIKTNKGFPPPDVLRDIFDMQ